MQPNYVFISSSTDDDDDDDDEKQCILKERGRLFGFIPVSINWIGRFVITSSSLTSSSNSNTNNNDGSSQTSSETTTATTTAAGGTAIHWDTTNLKMGWTISNKRLQFLNKVIGTTIDRPPVAEKLRIDPWYVNLPIPDDDDDGIDYVDVDEL